MTGSPHTVDVAGVGFGPANLALAIALEETGAPLRTVFFEAQPQLEWHPGMLLDGSSMQISFLKDLVTFRNPASRFSFVSFLHERGRLVDFTNRGSMEPLRIEFSAYLKWAAAAFDSSVEYGTRVTRITPVRTDDGIEAFDLLVSGPGGDKTVRARQVVVAAGLQPRLPSGVVPGQREWHSSDHLHRVGSLDDPDDLVVVGTGQSAMEVALDLSDRFPHAIVRVVSSQFGVGPSYQGPIVNQIFDPESVDLLYAADDEVRARLDRLHRNTNNGVASDEVIREFFDRVYRDTWLGRRRLVLHRASRLTSCTAGDGAQHVVIRSDLDGAQTRIAADAVVYGTGYTPFDPSILLDDAALLARDDAGRPLVRRDHTAVLSAPGSARLVLVGQSEHRHGLTSPLLSIVAVRAGEIAELLCSPLDLAPRESIHPEGTPARV